MTLEQRSKTKDALSRYGKKWSVKRPESKAWESAIEQTLAYYDVKDPLRSQLMRTRYFEHCTEEETLLRLNIGRSTYQKAQLDMLSTIAVYAAENGVKM